MIILNTSIILYIIFCFILGNVLNIISTKRQFSKANFTSVVGIRDVNNNESILVTTCPYCNTELLICNIQLHVNTNDPICDEIYYICPDCGKKVPIDLIPYNTLNCELDFLGNIFYKPVNLDSIVYTVNCPSKTNIMPILFSYNDTFNGPNNQNLFIVIEIVAVESFQFHEIILKYLELQKSIKERT